MDNINRTEGFIWKGIYIKAYNSWETLTIKKELFAQQQIAFETAEFAALCKKSNYKQKSFVRNCILPLISTITCGAKMLVFSPCICTPREYDSNKDGFFANLNMFNTVNAKSLPNNNSQQGSNDPDSSTEDQIVKDLNYLSKIKKENLIPVSYANGEIKFIIVSANKLLSSMISDEQIMIKIPAKNEENIDITIGIRETQYELPALCTLFGKPVETEEQLITNNISFYGWDLQMLSLAKTTEKDNARANKLITQYNIIKNIKDSNKVSGDIIAGCYYSKGEGKCSIKDNDLGQSILSLKQAVLDKDTELNHALIKHLLHKKGFNVHHEWILLELLEKGYARQIISIDILTSAIKKIIELAISNELDPNKATISFKATLCKYLNAILKPGLGENTEPINEILNVLFFSRLRAVKCGKLSERQLPLIIQSASKNPALLLLHSQSFFGIRFSKEILRKVRADKLAFLIPLCPLEIKDIKTVELKIKCAVQSREYSYLTLAKIINENEKANLKTEEKKKERANSFFKTTQKSVTVKKDNKIEDVKESGLEDVHIIIEDPFKGINKERTMFEDKVNILRASQPLFEPAVVNDEIAFPTSLYSCKADYNTLHNIKKYCYPISEIEVLEEWNAYIQGLNFHSVDGSETVKIESASFLLVLQLAQTKNFEIALKFTGAIFNSLKQIAFATPEFLLYSLTLTGLSYESLTSFAEAECCYTYSLWVYLHLYGDPAGRGNFSHPWGILLASRLKHLAELEKRVMDVEYMEELLNIMMYRKNKVMDGPIKLEEGVVPENHNILASDPFSVELWEWIHAKNPAAYPLGILWDCNEIASALDAKLGRLYPNLREIVSQCSETPGEVKPNKLLLSQGNSFAQLFTQDYGTIAKADMNGIVYVWGANNIGQLGLNTGVAFDGQKSVYPKLCTSLKDKVIVEIACGHCSSFALDIYGNAYSWGNNEFGQLGHGPEAPKIIDVPKRIKGLKEPITQISSGHEHTIALAVSGVVYSWGNGESGLLGHGDCKSSDIPKKIEFFNAKNITFITCGGLHSIAITTNGELYSWGRGDGGQLGIPSKVLEELSQKQGDFYSATPKRIFNEVIKNKIIITAACGEAHTLALDNAGRVYGWGLCVYGQLGLGFTGDSFEPGTGNAKSTVNEPAFISSLAGTRIVKVIGGATISLFLSDKGEVLLLS